MTEKDALKWLEDRGLRPMELRTVLSGECRWFPATFFNKHGQAFREDRYCLLPVEVYEALEFPQPDGWPKGERYPWFPSYEAAVKAAVKAVQRCTPGSKGMDDIIEEAKWVVKMFDQANTNKVIESIGSRGLLLKGAIEDLRAAMVKHGIDPYQTKVEGDWGEGWTGDRQGASNG